jgi:hypothetical protein
LYLEDLILYWLKPYIMRERLGSIFLKTDG